VRARNPSSARTTRPAAPRPAALCVAVLGLAVVSLAALAAGCGGEPPPEPAASATQPAPVGPEDARAQLAAHAAAAKDGRYAALYTLTSPQRPDRTVVVTRAVDGGWRVDIPGGALGGTADVAVARIGAGLFQCALPSADRLINPFCVRVAGRKGQLMASIDPQVQHVFVDWLDVFTDRGSAIAVSTARTPPGMAGVCYSVESNSASLAMPLDVGIYCYAAEGLLTGAKLSFGTLTLAGRPAPGPSEITLPGAVVDAEPLPQTSPPPPPTTPPATPATTP